MNGKNLSIRSSAMEFLIFSAQAEATTRKFRVVQMEGTRNIARDIDHYNLDAIK